MFSYFNKASKPNPCRHPSCPDLNLLMKLVGDELRFKQGFDISDSPDIRDGPNNTY